MSESKQMKMIKNVFDEIFKQMRVGFIQPKSSGK